MPRFIFNANSVAVGGHITRPFNQYIESQAACVLPSAGGRASATAPAYRLTNPGTGELVLGFDSAETSVRGDESSPGKFSTMISSSIRKLNVRDIFKVDEISVQLTLEYDLSARSVSIDTTGSRFVNLTISGQPFNVDVDYGMSRDASDYDKFKKNHPELKERKGKIYHSLGRNPQLKWEDEDFGYYDISDFGRVYFAEWIAAPDTQSLNMFRMQLGSPVGGVVVCAAPTGNGVPFPP